MKALQRDFMSEFTGLIVLSIIFLFTTTDILANSTQDSQSLSSSDKIAQVNSEPIKNRDSGQGNADKESIEAATPRDRDPSDPYGHSGAESSQKSNKQEKINPNTPSSGINDATTDSEDSSSTKRENK